MMPTAALLMIVAAAATTVAALPSNSALTYETFLSYGVTLKSGQIANAPAQNTPALPWIEGPAAIRFFNSTVVDESGAEVGPRGCLVLLLDCRLLTDRGLALVGAAVGTVCPPLAYF